MQLAPDDFDLMNRQGHNRRGDAFEDLQRRVAAAPDDFRLRLELDHALASQRRFAEVVAVAGHPEDGRAIRERGGARWHLGQHRQAVADMERACALGLQPACKDAQGMKARLGSR